MQVTEFPGLADELRKLPAQAAGRTRHLYRLIDLHASADASAALHAAAGKKSNGPGGRVLALADEILRTGSDSARDQLHDAIVLPEFLSLIPRWSRELRQCASAAPDSGACTVATALKLWSWTMEYFRTGDGARAESASQAIDELTEVLCPLLAARCFALEAVEQPSELRVDLSHVYAARASAAAASTCAELVFGYRRHLLWDAEGCATCFAAGEADGLEALIPGFASGARTTIDIIESDGSHPAKRGPCARFEGVDAFMRLRHRLDGCLTGVRVAKERAAAVLTGSAKAAKKRRA